MRSLYDFVIGNNLLAELSQNIYVSFNRKEGLIMEVRNCKECGKLFNYMEGAPVCPVCTKELEKKFVKVKEYVYDNPSAGIQEVAEENEVSQQQIKRWIREERLCFSEGSGVGLDCEKCGKMILTGRFCQNCKKELENSFGSMYQNRKSEPVQKKKSTSADGRMRFLG